MAALNPNRKRQLTASVFALVLVGKLAAQENVQLSASDVTHCDSVLRYAGREQLTQFDYDTRFAYATSKYCRDVGHDYDGKFFYGAVGIDHGYSGRDQQCRNELDFSDVDQSQFLLIDSVVERAISAWENCELMRKRGINVTANLESQSKVTLAFRRAGETTGEILGVDAENALCWSHFKSGDEFKYRQIKTADKVRVPDIGATTITCKRDLAQGEPTDHGLLLPDATVTVHTTEGPFSYTLPEDVALAGAWASELESRLREEIRSLRNSLDQTREEIPRRVVLDTPERRAEGRNGWSHSNQESKCDFGEGEVVTIVAGGQGFGHTYVKCSKIRIVP